MLLMFFVYLFQFIVLVLLVMLDIYLGDYYVLFLVYGLMLFCHVSSSLHDIFVETKQYCQVTASLDVCV